MADTHNRQLIGLDLVRFSAACMVMAFHLFDGTALAGAAACGWVGVEVFFVLSGFVIAYTAANSSAGRFLQSRIVRLMPAVWICGSLTAAMWFTWGGSSEPVRRYLDTLFLWPTGPWVDGSYWTLPVEIAFYALIFIVLSLRAFRRIELVAAALAAASTTYLLIVLLGLRLHLRGWVLPEALARLSLLEYGCYFALGVTLWLTFFDRPSLSRTLVGAVAALGGAVQIVFACRAFSATAPLAAPEAVWALAVGAMAVSAWRAEAIHRLVGARIAMYARQVGLATYPLYLLHDDLGSALTRAMVRVWGHPTACALFVAGLCVVAALTVAAWVEPPLQAWLRSALRRAPSLWPPLRRAEAGSTAE